MHRVNPVDTLNKYSFFYQLRPVHTERAERYERVYVRRRPSTDVYIDHAYCI